MAVERTARRAFIWAACWICAARCSQYALWSLWLPKGSKRWLPRLLPLLLSLDCGKSCWQRTTRV